MSSSDDIVAKKQNLLASGGQQQQQQQQHAAAASSSSSKKHSSDSRRSSAASSSAAQHHNSSTHGFEDRLAAAARRKELAIRANRFARHEHTKLKETHHHDVIEHRRELVKNDDTEAEEYDNYFTASGPGAAWRAREHISLKTSPRNLKKGMFLDAKDDPNRKKRTPAKISDDMYSRLSFQKMKQSTADVDEFIF